MPKYEYDVFVTPKDIREEMNNMGQLGWSIFHIEHFEMETTPEVSVPAVRLYMKRKIKEEPTNEA